MNRGWVNCGAILGPNQRPTFLGQHSMKVDRLFFTVVYRTCILLSLLTLVAHAQKPDDTSIEANPARPTVSTPATLVPVGYLQFETGVLGATHSPEFSSRFGLNEVIKLSVARPLELLAAAEPGVHYRAGGRKANGTGEVFLGIQAVLRRGEGARPTGAGRFFRRGYEGGRPGIQFGAPPKSVFVLPRPHPRGFPFELEP